MSHEQVKKGHLYIVSTPIGNIKDITLRALEVIKQVDIVLVEDTRSVQYLLKYYHLKDKHIVSYHSQNEPQRIPYIINLLQTQSVALISEAGTPLISDPGFILVQSLLEQNIPLVTIPGVTALTAALPLSGYPLGEFFFAGFLSSKEGKKKNQLQRILQMETVTAIYESPHRLEKTIHIMAEIFPLTMDIFIARELTKTYETLYRGTLQEVQMLVSSNNFVCKGEFVIIIDNTKQ